MSSGNKIIDGLREAIAGNFSRVTIEGQTWVRMGDNEGSVTINIRLTKKLKKQLMAAADASGVSLSEFIRAAAIKEAHRILGPELVVND